MSEPLWTAGPWTATYADDKPDLSGFWHIDEKDETSGFVATAWGCSGHSEANARLIAAAPKLYAALFREHGWFDPVKLKHEKDCGCAGCESYQALAEARGETP